MQIAVTDSFCLKKSGALLHCLPKDSVIVICSAQAESPCGTLGVGQRACQTLQFQVLMSVPRLLKKFLVVKLISTELVLTFTGSVCHLSLPKLACTSAVIFIVFVCKFGQLPFQIGLQMWLESTYIVSDTLTYFPLAARCVNNGHNNHNNTLQIEGCFSLQKIFSLRYSFISAQIILVIPFFFLPSPSYDSCIQNSYSRKTYVLGFHS